MTECFLISGKWRSVFWESGNQRGGFLGQWRIIKWIFIEVAISEVDLESGG